MNLEEYKGVFVFAQQVDNEVCGIAYELLGKAKELAQPLNTQVTAVLIGSDVKTESSLLMILNVKNTEQSHMHTLFHLLSMNTSQRSF